VPFSLETEEEFLKEENTCDLSLFLMRNIQAKFNVTPFKARSIIKFSNNSTSNK